MSGQRFRLRNIRQLPISKGPSIEMEKVQTEFFLTELRLLLRILPGSDPCFRRISTDALAVTVVLLARCRLLATEVISGFNGSPCS